METPVIYLDHAATSWPKPDKVIEAVTHTMLHDTANPGRGSHRMAVRSSRVLFEARKSLARLFGVANPNDIVLTSNTTHGLNLALHGFLNEGDHVIATSVEHNSVRRPLFELERTKSVQTTYIQTNEQGHLDIALLEQSINEHTKLIAVNHGSNLLGSFLPLAEIGALAKRRGIKLLVDAAQTAGVVPIDVRQMNIDMLAFPGHKGLLAPQGTGGLYIAPDVDLRPLMQGGTGSQSESLEQPLVRPDRYEAGTYNTPGAAGLAAGVAYLLERGVEAIYEHEWQLTQLVMQQLLSEPRIRILGPKLGEARTGIVALVIEGMDPSELAFILDQHYHIAVRAGFHCTPLAHQTVGTEGTGAIRASFGCFSTEEDAIKLVEALKGIISQY